MSMQTISALDTKGSEEVLSIPFLSTWIGSWQFSIKINGELQNAYNKRASVWAKKLKRMSVPQGYRAALDSILEDLSPKKAHNIRVLDGGTGAGDLSLALAEVTSQDFSLDAFDISPDMLKEADRRFKSRGINAKVHLADAANLPFGDNQFDVVMTAHMLEHMADPRQALSELVRVLKPGGHLISFITRRSMFGLGIHLKWRIHTVTPKSAAEWLGAQGLEHVHCLQNQEKGLLDRLSVTCIGQKPVAAE